MSQINNDVVLGGSWSIFTEQNRYNGELHFNSEERFITLELLIPDNMDGTAQISSWIGDIPYISGQLFNGTNIVLYKCRTGQKTHHILSHISQVFYADYIFWGLKIDAPDELVFHGASIDFGDILNWYELCCIDFHFPKENGKPLEFEWVRHEPVSFQYNDNLSITFTPVGRSGGNPFSLEYPIKQSVFVEFEYKTSVPWETILEDIKSIQYLIGLGTGHNIEIIQAKYHHSSLLHEYPDGKKRFMDADVTFGTGKVALFRPKQKYEYLFTFHEFCQIEEGMGVWSKTYARLKPILDLCFYVNHESGSPETAFLFLMQALETFHARFVTNNVNDYKTRVQDLLSKYKNEEVRKQWEDLLIDEGQKGAKKIYLRSRIADLMYAEGELPVRIGFGFVPTLVTKELCDTRNYYTHYEESKKEKAYSAEKLRYVNAYLWYLLHYHIMILLGFDKKNTRDKITEETQQIRRSEDIRKASQQKLVPKGE